MSRNCIGSIVSANTTMIIRNLFGALITSFAAINVVVPSLDFESLKKPFLLNLSPV